MATNINIAGRLHSMATGNTVAGADEILDDTLGKKQSVINQELYDSHQVQADWNQTDDTAPDYIKNKPTTKKEVSPKWEEIFENNLLVNGNFDGNTGWVITGNTEAQPNIVTIENNTCNINAGVKKITHNPDESHINEWYTYEQHPGYVSQTLSIAETGIYIAACYVSIDNIDIEFNRGEPSSSYPKGRPNGVTIEETGLRNIQAFIKAEGLGLSVREVIPSGSNKHYRSIDYSYVAMCRIMDKVPVLKVFVVREANTPIEVRFGCLNGSQGGITGKVYHAGLYKYTDDFPTQEFPSEFPFGQNLRYSDCYTNYKNYVESELSIVSPTFGVKYPDSECKQAFIDTMNQMADNIGLDSSVFASPLGSGSRVDCPDWYINYIEPSGTTDKGYTELGNVWRNDNIISYIYTDINSSVTYFAHDIYLDINTSNSYPTITYWTDDKFINACHCSLSSAGKFSRDETDDVLLKVPKECNKIIITTMIGASTPNLRYESDIQRNSNSVYVASTDSGNPPKSTYTTAKDLCIFGVVTFDKESIRRIYNEMRYCVHVDGNNPRDVVTGPDYTGNSTIGVTYIGHKGGDNGSSNYSYCWYMHDRLYDKRVVFAYLKKDPYSTSIYSGSQILLDGLSAIRTNGEFNHVSAYGAAGGYLPDENIYTKGGSVGNYLMDLGGSHKIAVPMSCTKMMTALVATECCDLDEMIKYTTTDVYYGSGWNDWEEGDKLTLQEAIGAMLTKSDNSLAVTISRCVGEKILMNRDNY